MSVFCFALVIFLKERRKLVDEYLLQKKIFGNFAKKTRRLLMPPVNEKEVQNNGVRGHPYFTEYGCFRSSQKNINIA